MNMDAAAASYGVTPLEFAATPQSAAREWFDRSIIDAHLDRLEREQQPDGGWPISWDPPSEASRCEWRGIRTLFAAHTLSAYRGRHNPAT